MSRPRQKIRSPAAFGFPDFYATMIIVFPSFRIKRSGYPESGVFAPDTFWILNAMAAKELTETF
jgi:hypothetical protein